MTSTLTYLAAREHINDLVREAERSRRCAELRGRRRIRLTLPRLVTRSAPRAAAT